MASYKRVKVQVFVNGKEELIGVSTVEGVVPKKKFSSLGQDLLTDLSELGVGVTLLRDSAGHLDYRVSVQGWNIDGMPQRVEEVIMERVTCDLV